MKNIYNWTVGTFFRTLTRILTYILIGFVVFLIISKLDYKGIIIPRLNAQVNENNNIIYSYVNDFIINNKTNSFFETSGSLELIRNTLEQNSNTLNNAKYLIGFTQDDIVVVIDYNRNSEFYMFSEVYTTFDRILINSNTISGMTSTNSSRYYYKLSDYNNVNNFINGILTSDNKKHEYNYSDYYRLAFTTNIDLRNTTYNWFEYNRNYFIPYYTNTNIKNSCYGSGCTYSDIQNIPFKINGITQYIPTYYNMYGSAIPNSSLVPNSFKVYKEFFTINPSKLNDIWSVSINFHYLLNSSNGNTNIKVYGLINDNGIYHYEDISNYFTINGYTFSCNSGVKVCTFNIDNTNISYNTNLSNYIKIYFDINIDNYISIQPGSFTYTRSIPEIYDIGINDVSKDTLFLQLESSSINTYTFTTSNFNNTQIFFSNVISNDMLYNIPSYVDLQTSTFNNEVLYSSSNYYYGLFNKVLFENNVLSYNNGIIMNLYSNEIDNIYGVSGSFQILYFITPNLYWSNSEYSSDRNSVCTNYYNNGNIENICISGDFHNYNSEYSNINNYFNIAKGLLNDEMYGLSGLILTPLNKLEGLLNATCEPLVLPVPFTNETITIPCLSTTYNEKVPQLIAIYHLILLGITSYYIGVGIFKDIKNTLESDKNDIEVIDL